MKKKIVLLLSFVLAFTLALGILAVGCKKTKKEEVIVAISKTTLEVVVGKTGTLTATASNGSELVWTTDNEDVATVDAGKVTGVKAGTANITATVKDGEASASCAVTVVNPTTFAFTVDGETVTEITVDRNGDPVQLAATASDGSDITGWSTDIPDCLTVVNGLVTGLKEGTGKITVTSSSKAVGEIAVTVIDTIEGEHYQITDEQSDGQWYYGVRTDKGQTWEVEGELREGVVTFKYDGGNWDVGSIYLAVKNPDITNGWWRLTFDIHSDIETVITVNGTRVDLVEGDNKVNVCYQQTAADSVNIVFGNSEAGTVPTAMTVQVSNLKWEPFKQVDLQLPTFTLDEEGNIEIEDPNEEGVSRYEVALFAEGSDVAVYTLILRTTEGKLDTSAVEQNGEYFVKIRAVGNIGFNSTDWSDEDKDLTWTIENTDIKYELSNEDGTHGGGAKTAVVSGKWEYYVVTEEYAFRTGDAKYENGTVTFDFQLGWTWYGAQLFRHYSEYEPGTSLEIKMTITATESGNITVCGEVVTLVKDVPKEVTVYVIQPDNTGKTEDLATTISIAFMEQSSGQLPTDESLPKDTPIKATVSNISVKPYVQDPLKKVEATYTAADKENEVAAKIEITKDENEEDTVASYQVGFFKTATATKPETTAYIEKDGTFSDLSVEDGEYYLRVRAVAATALNSDSEWSDVLNEEVYIVSNGGKVEPITSGGQVDSVKDPDVWYIWTDAGKITTKTVTTVTESKAQTVAVAYTTASNAWYSVQLFYKNSKLSADTVYTLSLKINSSVDCIVTINGTVKELKAGDNEITVYYKETSGAASLVLVFGLENAYDDNAAGPVAAGTFTVSNVNWEAYELKSLEVPPLYINGTTYSIPDVANTDAGSVAGYRITIYSKDGKLISSKTVTEPVGELDVALLETGSYDVTVTAVGTLLYTDSAESEKVNLEVLNEGGITYELTFGQAATDQWGGQGIDVDGRYYCWNDQNWAGSYVTMNEKTYEDGTITLDYTCTSGGSDFAVQILRKSNELTTGEQYTLSFNINVTTAIKISINEVEKQLQAGDNQIEVTFTAYDCTQAGGACVFALSLHTSTQDGTASNKVVISDILYTLVEAE